MFLSKVTELILDDLFEIDNFSEDHKKALEKYINLSHLSLNRIGLKSLKNFPNLTCLKKVHFYLMLNKA